MTAVYKHVKILYNVGFISINDIGRARYYTLKEFQKLYFEAFAILSVINENICRYTIFSGITENIAIVLLD
jgi:hypothetical protein